MEIKSDYLTGNKDFEEFLSTVSDNTGRRNIESWFKNLYDNREIFKVSGWASDKLQGEHKGKAAIIMGASPAIKLQVDTLRELNDDNDFVLCGISSNLECLLSNGIKPKDASV